MSLIVSTAAEGRFPYRAGQPSAEGGGDVWGCRGVNPGSGIKGINIMQEQAVHTEELLPFSFSLF